MSAIDFSGSSTKTTTASGSNGSATTNGGGSHGSGGASNHNNQNITTIPVPGDFINYNQKFADARPLKFRDDVIKDTLAVLIAKKKSNAILLGHPGVGKSAVAGEIARRIVASDPSIPAALENTTVFELPLNALNADTMYRGQLEGKIQHIIEYATTQDCIVFIDELHQITDWNNQNSGVAEALKPALADGSLKIIGATTTNEYRAIADEPALARRFTTVTVDEPTMSQTEDILADVAENYLDHYASEQLTVDDKDKVLPRDIIHTIATVADDMVPGHRPDTALTLLDRVLGDTTLRLTTRINTGVLTTPTLLRITDAQVRSTASRLSGTGRNRSTSLSGTQLRDALDHALDNILHQDHVTDTCVTKTVRHTRGLFAGHTPEVWMFAGPSGVGKSETARRIAEVISDDPLIRLDMSEYSASHDVSRLIGVGRGYVGYDSAGELPFDAVKTNPRQVILLDEMEKAHRLVHNLFLQIFDTGILHMADGTRIDFSKCIIIATTNAAGALSLGRGSAGFNLPTSTSTKTAGPVDPVDQDKLVKKLSETFAPEFIGRFGWITSFNQITRDVYREILINNYSTARDHVIDIRPDYADLVPETIDADDLDTLATTYRPETGARPARHAVINHIENIIDDALDQ